jgi:hypothetical protein
MVMVRYLLFQVSRSMVGVFLGPHLGMNGIGLSGAEIDEGTAGVNSNSRGSPATAPSIKRSVLLACTGSVFELR